MGSDQDVLFKFSQPSGAQSNKPSQGMTNALRQFSESEEMQALVGEARAQGRKVVVHVYHSAAGHPILIHLAAVAQEAA